MHTQLAQLAQLHNTNFVTAKLGNSTYILYVDDVFVMGGSYCVRKHIACYELNQGTLIACDDDDVISDIYENEMDGESEQLQLAQIYVMQELL